MAAAERFELAAGGQRTRILVGAGVLDEAAAELAPWLDGRRVFLLSTPVVDRLYGEALGRLAPGAARLERLEAPDGEGAKTLAQAERLWSEMLERGGKRDSRLLVAGGGGVTDLGGFVAAAFLRGVEHALLPTTLLAQVDAAIGGKTGVNLPRGKNAVGAFHAPRWVVSEVVWLASLPRAELAAGMAEVVKVAALADPALLARLEDRLDALLAGDAGELAPVVAAATAAKLAVVARDPRERDRRRWLNFGHTLGHALEAAAGYAGLRHGEAVSWGMLFALRLSRRRGLAEEAARRLEALVLRLDPPRLPSLDAGALAPFLAGDKKAREGVRPWILLRGPGRPWVCEDLDPATVEHELAAFLSAAVESARPSG